METSIVINYYGIYYLFEGIGMVTVDMEAEGTAAYMGWMAGKVGTVDTADVANSVGCSCTYDQDSIRSEDIGSK